MRTKGGRKKVLMVLPKLDRGGAEMLLQYMLADGFSDEFDVSICTLCPSCDPASAQKFRELGVSVHYLDMKRTNFLRIMYMLYHLMLEIRPDILHTHLYPIMHSVLPAALAGIPVRIHTVHNVACRDGGFLSRMAVRIASGYFGFTLIGISETIASTIKQYHGVDNVPIIHNGIPVSDTRMLSRSCNRDAFGIHKDDFLCISVASFSARKNHMMLIDAFRRALSVRPELFLFLVGQGPLSRRIENLTKEFGISDRVRFLGLRDDVTELLCMSDLFLLSSHWEGLPISALEAMSAGLPVVTTDVGGLRDLVENGISGRLIDPQNVQSFADAIEEMAKDRERSRSMGEEGRKRVQRDFSISSAVREHEKLYRELLGDVTGYSDE